MWLYDLPTRRHVPEWINLKRPWRRPPLPELPLDVRVARAVTAMRERWEAYDAHYDRDVDYDAEGSDSESEWDDAEESDDYAEDPDEEWYTRKKATL